MEESDGTIIATEKPVTIAVKPRDSSPAQPIDSPPKLGLNERSASDVVFLPRDEEWYAGVVREV